MLQIPVLSFSYTSRFVFRLLKYGFIIKQHLNYYYFFTSRLCFCMYTSCKLVATPSVAPDFDYLSKYWVAKLAKDDA
jgi:hypothetical protein